jgi:hypothetical protein
LNEEGVGIVTLRQENATCGDAVHGKAIGQLLCSLLAALVLIHIEGDINGAFAFAQLPELVLI